MSALNIIWTVIKSLIALGIYAGMLSVANTSLEKVVVAGLGIIYTTIIFYGTTIIRAQLQISFQQTEQFHRLIRTIDHSGDLESDEISLKRSIEAIKSKNTEYYINIGTTFLIWLTSVSVIILSL